MILNNAVIERMMIDDKTYTSTKEFIDALLACKDLIADVYVNNQLVTSGLLNLSVNNNWIIGNVDERLSLENLSSADFIRILVHQIGYDYDDVEHIIMSTSSPLSTFIDPGDVDADLYFSIMSTVPECTQRCFVPDSVFRMMGSSNIIPKDFSNPSQCPSDPTVVPETPIVMYTLQPYGKEGYVHAIFTMSNVDYDQEGAYTWVISPATAGKFNINGTGNSATKEYQNPNPEDPEYKAIVAGAGITVTVIDEQEKVLFEDVTATLVD